MKDNALAVKIIEALFNYMGEIEASLAGQEPMIVEYKGKEYWFTVSESSSKGLTFEVWDYAEDPADGDDDKPVMVFEVGFNIKFKS